MFLLRFLLIVFTLGSLVYFQNCSPSFQVGEDGSLISAGGTYIDRRGDPTGDSIEVLRSLAPKFAAFDPSLASGTHDANCMNNSSFDACIFWKNPVSTQVVFGGNSIPVPAENMATPPEQIAAYQNFGIRLTGAANNSLRTTDFNIHYKNNVGSARYLTLNNGKFKQSLATGYASTTPEDQRYATEQIQTYHFLNLFKNMMVQKAGTFHAAARNIPVNVFSQEAGYNAFYDRINNRVELGFREGTDGRRYSIALNSEATVHEMGHANMHFANLNLLQADTDSLIVLPCQSSGPNSFFITDLKNARQNEAGVLSSLQSTCGHQNTESIEYVGFCRETSGCIDAIDEGQADFFAFVTFARWPTNGELAMPSKLFRYWKKRSLINRDNITQKMGLTYVDDYLKRSITFPGEIHDVGEVYTEILFDIYTDPGVDRDTFVRTVNEHLRQLSGASTFVSSKDVLLAIDQSTFAGRNQIFIRAHFQNRGF